MSFDRLPPERRFPPAFERGYEIMSEGPREDLVGFLAALATILTHAELIVLSSYIDTLLQDERKRS